METLRNSYRCPIRNDSGLDVGAFEARMKGTFVKK